MTFRTLGALKHFTNFVQTMSMVQSITKHFAHFGANIYYSCSCFCCNYHYHLLWCTFYIYVYNNNNNISSLLHQKIYIALMK